MMEFPYMGTLIKQSSINELTAATIRTTKAEEALKTANSQHTHRIEQIKSSCTRTADDSVSPWIRTMATVTERDAFALQYMLIEAIPRAVFKEDDAITQKLNELLMLTKLTYADEIAEAVEKAKAEAQQQTDRALDEKAKEIKQLDYNHEKAAQNLKLKVHSEQSNLTYRKEVFANQINRLLSLTNGEPEALSEEDNRVLRVLHAEGFLTTIDSLVMFEEHKFLTMSKEEIFELFLKIEPLP